MFIINFNFLCTLGDFVEAFTFEPGSFCFIHKNSTDFSIKLTDYEINGVPIDAGKVAKEPKITVTAEFR